MSPYLIFNVPSTPTVTSERNTKVINSEVGGSDDGAVSNTNAKHYRVMTVTMGDHYVLGFAPIASFLRSQNLCWLYKGPSDTVCIRMRKDHVRALKSRYSMSEFGGLWKHSNNTACTKTCDAQWICSRAEISARKKEINNNNNNSNNNNNWFTVLAKQRFTFDEDWGKWSWMNREGRH